jgi:hypothetical protein
MRNYFGRFLVCFLFVIPSWLAGATQNMANGGDLLVTAGFAAVLAWVLGLGLARGDRKVPQGID